MIKLVIVDLSAVVRSLEKEVFSSCPEFDVVAGFADASILVESCKKIKPDLVLCSADIPKIREAVQILSQELKITSIVLRNSFSESILFYGATEMPKPDFISISKAEVNVFINKILQIYELSDASRISTVQKKLVVKQKQGGLFSTKSSFKGKKSSSFEVLIIGVSTGGPKTLQNLIRSLGKDFPLPILITQHVDTTFDKNMVSWLDKTVDLSISLAQDNSVPLPGHVYFAPADYHLVLKKEKNQIKMILDPSAPVNFLRPSVDKMFESAANLYGAKCLALLLTGMGNDGVNGCKAVKNVSGYTIGESEESCVVYGMSKSAFEAGVIDEMLSLESMGQRIKQLVKEGDL